MKSMNWRLFKWY